MATDIHFTLPPANARTGTLGDKDINDWFGDATGGRVVRRMREGPRWTVRVDADLDAGQASALRTALEAALSPITIEPA